MTYLQGELSYRCAAEEERWSSADSYNDSPALYITPVMLFLRLKNVRMWSR